MTQTTDYDDYSSLDAPEHLIQALRHFFTQKRNTYTYTLAKKHFDELEQDDTYPDASRIFKIITGTNLVTKKHISQYRAAQGMQYLIKKGYAQSAARNLQSYKRATKQDTNASVPTPTKSPFIQLMQQKTPIDDSTDDKSTTKPSPAVPPTTQEVPTDGTTTADPKDTAYEDYSVKSDVTKHADDLEKTMDSAFADIQKDTLLDESKSSTNTNEVADLIQTILHQEFNTIINRLETKEAHLESETARCKQMVISLQQTIDKTKEFHAEFLQTCEKMYLLIGQTRYAYISIYDT